MARCNSFHHYHLLRVQFGQQFLRNFTEMLGEEGYEEWISTCQAIIQKTDHIFCGSDRSWAEIEREYFYTDEGQRALNADRVLQRLFTLSFLFVDHPHIALNVISLSLTEADREYIVSALTSPSFRRFIQSANHQEHF